MNKLLPIIISFTLVVFVNTKAKCDHFILNGDTSYIDSKSPLEQCPLMLTLRPKLADYGAGCYDCDCTAYDAEWTIIDGRLYLTNIYSCQYSKARLKADINAFFNVDDGKVEANWVTDTLWVPKGKIIAHHDMMLVFYKAETKIFIVNGIVISIKEFDYPKQEESIYHRDGPALSEFIYSNINWTKIPNLEGQAKKVFISCETGASGKPENVRAVRGVDEKLYKDEAIRVMSMVPWSVFYRHGKVLREGYFLPITFSEENRKKYAH